MPEVASVKANPFWNWHFAGSLASSVRESEPIYDWPSEEKLRVQRYRGHGVRLALLELFSSTYSSTTMLKPWFQLQELASWKFVEVPYEQIVIEMPPEKRFKVRARITEIKEVEPEIHIPECLR